LDHFVLLDIEGILSEQNKFKKYKMYSKLWKWEKSA